MSEDIDLKVVLIDQRGLSESAQKNHLSVLKSFVLKTVKSMGFDIVDAESKARNSNRYSASGWIYQSIYERHSSLRPHLSQVRTEHCTNEKLNQFKKDFLRAFP
jgi:hypothetical protein